MSWFSNHGSTFVRSLSNYAIDSLSKSDNPRVANAMALVFDRSSSSLSSRDMHHGVDDKRSNDEDQPFDGGYYYHGVSESSSQTIKTGKSPTYMSSSSLVSTSSAAEFESSTSTAYDAATESSDNDRLRPALALWGSRCFRSSSSLTLNTAESDDITPPRRRLLLVYIHGFMGSETSFRDFPSHVHNVVSIALAGSHVVYSKVYPRYKSRRAMDIACEDFSRWFSPHEADDLDVILLGHSLGGILAADVALLPSDDEGHGSKSLRHRILGLINFDVPFLGMHPGVVSAGLESLFRRNQQQDQDTGQGLEEPVVVAPANSSRESDAPIPSDLSDSQIAQDRRRDSLFDLPTHDPHFEPAFENDVHLIQRGRFQGALHFLEKNSGHVYSAVKAYAKSYLEFSGCIANYPELERRYRKLVQLEAVDEYNGLHDHSSHQTDTFPPQRLRFVNYFTASTGFIKSKHSKNSTFSQDEHSEDASVLAEQISHINMDERSLQATRPHTATKKSREHKFCRVPAKNATRIGESLWVKVYMDGVDEVVAHQSMFQPKGPYYEKLVGDTAARIEQWIQDDLTRRLILDGGRDQAAADDFEGSLSGEFPELQESNGGMIKLIDCEAEEEQPPSL